MVKTHRLIFTLDDTTKKDAERIVDIETLASFTALVRRAIKLYIYYSDCISNGHQFILREKNGKEYGVKII